MSVLPVAAVALPLVAAVLVPLLGRVRAALRNAFVVAAVGADLLLVAALVPQVAEHHRVTAAVLPAFMGGLCFTVDSFSLLFALFSALVWFASTLYALDYLAHEQHHDRYHITNLVALASMLGVVMAGDLVTLYLFFESLGLVAFLFVIHAETDEAKRAGVKYFWMTVVGGFALFGGIVATFGLGGSGTLAPLPAGGPVALKWLAAGLLVLGFGVKAGMQPVHVWLPDAHPVAPSPASALLSGVMIKAGAYGIFRTVTALFRPEVSEHLAEHAWAFSSELGMVVLWIGIFTMFTGVCMALLQSNAKRMLAYHSVSQMGFILAGIGAAGYLGAHGAMGIAGGLFHVLNHALFKACLFLGVGAVYFRTRSLDMYRLGGLAKRMPFTFAFMAVAAAGITGVPLFNGFVSKCMIHHALVEAHDLHHLASLGFAEKVYIVTCGGTACSFIKLIGLTFLGRPKVEYGPEVREAPPRMLVAMGVLAAAIIMLGVRPQLVIRGIFEPGLHLWGLHFGVLEEYLAEYFLRWGDISSVLVAFAIGASVFTVGMKTGLFHAHLPRWLSIDWWYLQTVSALGRGIERIGRTYDAWLRGVSDALCQVRDVYDCSRSRVERWYRRAVAVMTTGVTERLAQRAIARAEVALEVERHEEVRQAVDRAVRLLSSAGVTDEGEWRDAIEAVRESASYIAQRLFAIRLAVVQDAVRQGHAREVLEHIDGLVADTAATREHVAAAAFAAAADRRGGRDVVRRLAAAANAAASEERFDLKVKAAIRGRPVAAEHLAARAEEAPAAAARSAREAFEGGSSWSRRTSVSWSRWLLDMLRLGVDAMTRERAGRVFDTSSSEESVLFTRRAITRYARDMSFNVAVIVGVLLLFVAAVMQRR
ncbi:complex I subunit 5 family protein [Coriobacteriia bacterium Es71-Z0120]|uniref:complex I subunit 5 family protein n=1 Tax=Parvivirga hydrogeniphila TaxID=2939460 RepID=UPI002260DF09|nr:complex I subunit 5 family protein [Parvivirga hydrogeniphila]MCL4078658.1 complex I subunit 5 family protein [Parvivirga hydrogeniphila]